MDMFSPSVYEFAHNRVQEPVVPASGAQAEDGECKALRELAALLSDHAGVFSSPGRPRVYFS
jgi:hypothetical protein